MAALISTAVAVRSNIKGNEDADTKNKADAAHVKAFLDAHPDVKFIRYIVNPYSNKPIAQVTTTARALALASHPAAASLSSAHPSCYLSTTVRGFMSEFLRPSSDTWLPDWSSLRYLGTAAPRHASVMCFVDENVENPSSYFATANSAQRNQDKSKSDDSKSKSDDSKPESEAQPTKKQEPQTEDVNPIEARCPRRILQRTLAYSKEKYGISFQMGTEIEFMLVETHKATSPVVTPSSRWSTGAFRCAYFQNVVEESVLLIEESGIPIWNFTAEGGTGSFEIALGALPPLQAIDALTFAREVIKSCAFKYGCHATLHPKPFETEAPMGSHVHLSFSSPSDVSGDNHGDAFLMGMLKHFRSITSLLMASYDSYGCRENAFGSGPISWGWDNRENPIRRLGAARYEIRAPDGTANLYLGIAALIGVGIKGIEDGEVLSIEDNRNTDGEVVLTEAQMKELGVTDSLPKDLSEAVEATAKDEVVREVLGALGFEKYIELKRKEVKISKEKSSVERREGIMQYI